MCGKWRSEGGVVRRVRVCGAGARQRPPGGDRRSARAGRAFGRGDRERDLAERREHLAAPACSRSGGSGSLAPGGDADLLPAGERARERSLGGSPRCRGPPRRRGEPVGRRVPGRAGRGRACFRYGASGAVGAGRRGRARRAAGARVQGGAHPGREVGTAPGARFACPQAAAPPTDRRLLPGSLLRLCRRRRPAAASARAEGAPPGRRLSRVAAGGPAGRNELTQMLLRPFLNDATSCASYLFGCGTHAKLAVVDPHAELVDDYLATAAALGALIVAVFETHLQADHVSGLPALVTRTGATAYLPADTGVEFEHVALADGDVVELGNTLVTAIATPGHAPAHHAYTVADRRRGTEEPWLVLSGDSLLIGDVGRPDLHVAGDAHGQARLLHASLQRLLELPAHVVLYPSHYAGSVCGRGLSGNPVSSIGFERANNPLLATADPDAFVDALLKDMPPRPVEQEAIVAANRSGTVGAP